MFARSEHLAKGDQRIHELEKELSQAQTTSREAKEKYRQANEQLSRTVSTGLSFIDVIDSLGVTIHEAISTAADRMIERK